MRVRVARLRCSWAAYAYEGSRRSRIFFGKTREEVLDKVKDDHKTRVLRHLPPYPAPLGRL